MASTPVKENVVGQVIQVTRRGPQGQYKEKVVQYNGKDYVVGKNDRDSVEVGKKYSFNLSKSEYNDKLYYWANLVKDEDSDEGGNSPSSDQRKKEGFSWLNSLTKEEKKKVIIYLLDKVTEDK